MNRNQLSSIISSLSPAVNCQAAVAGGEAVVSEKALKPCPFCGCEVRIVARDASDEFFGERVWYHIEGCHDGVGGICPGQVRARGSAETAINAWNRRA
jgi:hypothetical protein